MIQYFKRIISHTLIYGLGDMAVKAIGFLLIPLYTRYLNPDDYGIWSLVQTSQMILILILSLGFNSAVFKVYHETDTGEEKDCVVSTALIFLIAWGIPATGIVFYGAEFLSRLIFGSPDEALYLRYVACAVFLDLFRLIALSLLRAREKPVSFSIINIIHFTLLVILNILNVAVRKQGILGIVQSQLITSAAIALGTGVIFLRRIGFRFSKKHLRLLLDFGIPLVPSGISIWGLTMTAQYFIHHYRGDYDVGLYSLGMRFGMIVNMILVRPFRTAWLPFMFSIKREEKAKQVYGLTLTYFLMAGMALVLFLSVLSREIVQILATANYIDGHRVIPLIALAYLFYGLYYTADVGILLSGKTRYYALVTFMAALFQVGLNFLVVPVHGMMGASWVVLGSFIFLFVTVLLVSRKLYPIRYEYTRLLKIGAAGAAVFGISRWIQGPDLALTIVFKVLWILSYPVWLYVFRFFTIQEKKAVRTRLGRLLTANRR